jgi:hypothetical protein
MIVKRALYPSLDGLSPPLGPFLFWLGLCIARGIEWPFVRRRRGLGLGSRLFPKGRTGELSRNLGDDE